jgi:hypothetical protein
VDAKSYNKYTQKTGWVDPPPFEGCIPVRGEEGVQSPPPRGLVGAEGVQSPPS